MANILSPKAQKRLRAMNDVFGIEPEQIQEGLSPLEVGMIAPRTYDAFISAPTRSAIGSAITGGNVADIGQAAAKQFGSDPELAPSFGFVEDILADPLALPGMLSGATKLVPKVYSRLKALGEAGSADLGFYSRLKELIQEKMGGKATPEQIMSIARGGKAEEIADLGLQEFVKDKPKLSRADVLDYIEQQSPKLEETVRGTDPYKIKLNNKWKELGDIESDLRKLDPNFVIYTMYIESGEGIPKNAPKKLIPLLKKYEIVSGEREALRHKYTKGFLETKYADMPEVNLPGGENPKEILIQVGDKAKDSQKRLDDLYKIADKRNLTEAESNEMVGLERVLAGQESYSAENVFYSQHWNEPNVLLHNRMVERIDDEGKKVLHLEEIQSDWHQQGKKKGYKGQVKIPLESELVAIRDPDFKRAGYSIQTKDGEFVTRVFGDPVTRKTGEPYGVTEWTPETAIQEAIHRIKEYPQSVWPQSRFRQDTKTPNAPFKQSWVELGVKRAIKEAVDSGADRLIWTPGKLQADRYNLAKHIDEIAYNPETNDLIAYPSKGERNRDAIRITVSKENLPKYLGEEQAKQLLQTKPRNFGFYSQDNKFHVLTNQDLEMGGEFHKNLYDRKIPNFLKEFGKKYGAKVGFTTINNGQFKVPYFEITPELKKAVLEKGLPLYAVPLTLRMRALEDGDRE